MINKVDRHLHDCAWGARHQRYAGPRPSAPLSTMVLRLAAAKDGPKGKGVRSAG